ncbi:MAG: class I SAM-dependent methyltransferase, partial [Chloroflexi bacterium]|nr:class I SAM-dependent methyltransferase [Chloroflexota bacterium]
LAEMVRVLQPGGRVVILEIVRLEGRGLLARVLPVYFRYVTPWLGALLAGDREAYTYLPQSVEGFLSAGELAALMKIAGLQDVSHDSLGLGTVAIHTGVKP